MVPFRLIAKLPSCGVSGGSDIAKRRLGDHEGVVDLPFPFNKSSQNLKRIQVSQSPPRAANSQGGGPNAISAQLRRGVSADIVIMSREGLNDLIAEG